MVKPADILRGLCIAALSIAALLAAPTALATDLLWTSYSSSYGEALRSVKYPSPAVDEEAADDFNVSGTIERLLIYGQNDCTFGCYNPVQPAGVYIRFYQWTAGGPGILQHEEFFAGGDSGFLFNAEDGVGTIDVTLHEPFEATGWHFLSAQLVYDAAFNWRRSPANAGAPLGSYAVWRNKDGAWQQPVDYWGAPLSQDLAVDLYGCPAGGCAALPPVAGCGEWYEIASPNPDGDARLEDVAVLAPWDAWAVGSFYGPIQGYFDDRQQSLTMHWDGSDWTVVPSPSPGPNPSTVQVLLEAVSAAATNDVWAVGWKQDQNAGGYVGGRVLAMHWDGFAWQDMDAPWPLDKDGTPYTSASGEQLYDVDARAADDVWMVGRYWSEQPNGVIRWPGVAMRWNGSGFEVHELPMVSPAYNQVPVAVAAVSSDDVWAVGEGNGTSEPAYIWHWNGASWVHVPGPTPGVDRALADVLAFSSDDVWAGGWYRDASWNYFPLIIHWNGTSWTAVPTPAGGQALAAWGPDDILSFGLGGWAHWDGTAWSQDRGPTVIPSGAIRGMATAGSCELWAVGWKFDVRGEMTLTEKLQLAGGAPDDADADGVTDASDNCPAHYNPDQVDCDGDAAGDVCELVLGTALDCNGNLTPDNCETFADCDGNAVPDECEVDCNANGQPDACDIAGGSPDCDANGVLDSCEIFADCNTNGLDDWCDINESRSLDTNANGYPDECEALGPDYATVNTVDDVVDFGGAQRMDDLPGPDGLVSFREAVMATNNTPGAQTVAFNIPPAEWDPLLDTEALLALEIGAFFVTDDETTLDFATQTAFTGDTNPNGGEVAIYGYEPNGWGIAAIYIQGDRCTVKGLGRVLQRGYGVRIEGNDSRVVGSSISGPFYAAVYVTGGWQGPVASGNVIGGTLPGEGNSLSAGNDGVRIDGPAANNVVVGNVLSGSWSGVDIRAGASGNRIGGPTLAERNIISGAGHYGEEGCPTGSQVSIEDSPGNVVENNYIGLTPDGLSSEGQDGTMGVWVSNSPGTIVRNNAVGGILVIGTNHCNKIRYGTAVAVTGGSANTVVQGNLIGTDVSGVNPLVNHAGVVVAPEIQAGTPTSILVADNRIAFNETVGVAVDADVTGVTILANSISDNGGLGIDLSGSGNAGQSAPLLTSVVTDEVSVTVSGMLSSTPLHTYRIEFFVNSTCDPSGAGEGETLVGAILVTTDATGTVAFESTFAATVVAGEVLTATATELSTGNTSQFSTCVEASVTECTGLPPEVSGLHMEADHVTLTWSPFGPSVSYDVARGTMSGLRAGAGATCLESGVAGASYQDLELPAAGESFFYLVRAVSACGAGPWGAIEVTACP